MINEGLYQYEQEIHDKRQEKRSGGIKVETVDPSMFTKMQRTVSSSSQPSVKQPDRKPSTTERSDATRTPPPKEKDTKLKSTPRFFALKDESEARKRRPNAVPDTRQYHNRVPVGWMLGYVLC
jgi:hypothetical protein